MISADDIDFLIIGAAKSATTWLQRALQSDPAVRMPDPELHYFSREAARGDEWYLAQFPDIAGAGAVGEKSNSYMEEQAAAGRIAALLPHARLVALLRNPVDRAYSDYCMLYRRGEVGRNVERWLDPRVAAGDRFVAGGRYHEQLVRFYDLFPVDRILVLLHEDLVTDPLGEVNRLRSFLALPPASTATLPTERVKDRGAPIVPRPLRTALAGLKPLAAPLRGTAVFEWSRSLVARPPEYPRFPPELRARLAEHYAPDMDRLEEAIGRDVSIWREQGARPARPDR